MAQNVLVAKWNLVLTLLCLQRCKEFAVQKGLLVESSKSSAVQSNFGKRALSVNLQFKAYGQIFFCAFFLISNYTLEQKSVSFKVYSSIIELSFLLQLHGQVYYMSPKAFIHFLFTMYICTIPILLGVLYGKQPY